MHTYFPLRRGCSVIPYQDAHVPDHSLPEIELDEGKVYRQEKCWEDICHAIVEAHHLVYIVGWSIYHKVKLVRESESTCRLPSGKDTTLGELLKYKSQEGLRVLMLIWDDKTSHDNFVLKTVRLMTCIA
jgi:phospholipase D1/2